MLSKLGYGIALCLVVGVLGGCAGLGLGGPKKQALTIADVNPDLRPIEGTELDAVKKQDIKYVVTGDAIYDKYFKDAAIAYGGFSVARTMSEDVTKNLKNFARDAKASAAQKESDPESPSLERDVAVLMAQKPIPTREAEYFAKAAHNVAVASVSLTGSTEASARLLPQAKKLISDVKTAFGMADAPGIANELQNSVKRLTQVKDDALPLAKNLTALAGYLASLTGKQP